MLYDNGPLPSGSPRLQPNYQRPYSNRPAPVSDPTFQPVGRRQGSYADYYNGMTGGSSSTGRSRQLFYDMQKKLQHLGAGRRTGQYSPQGNIPYAQAPMQPSAPQLRYASGVPGGMQQGGMLGYLQRPVNNRDHLGNMPGEWDYQWQPPMPQYPMVTY